jgi:hypothetical protein
MEFGTLGCKDCVFRLFITQLAGLVPADLRLKETGLLASALKCSGGRRGSGRSLHALAFVSSAEGPSGCCGGGAVAVAELLLVPSPGPVPALGASKSPACFSSGVSPPENCTADSARASSEYDRFWSWLAQHSVHSGTCAQRILHLQMVCWSCPA